MHEMSVASALVEEVLENVKGLRAMKVDEVHLRIGEFAFISDRQLRFCFDLLKKDHKLTKGAALKISKEKATVGCKECGFKGGVKDVKRPEDHRLALAFECPKCGGTLDIVSGREMVIQRISVLVPEIKGKRAPKSRARRRGG